MPGKHERILTEEEFRDAVAGVEARKVHRGKRPKSSKRLYLLRGLTYCSCGARMRGDARLSRGQEWRYYSCAVSDGKGGRLDEDGNLVACHAKRVRADEAERFVVEALSGFLLPPDEIATAREELRQRLRAPKPGVADEQRARLRNRLEKLRDLYTWGDLTEAEFRTQKAEAEAQLLALPDNNKLVMFDKHRALASSLPDAIAAAAPEKLQELVALLVERVETADCRVGRVVWVPAARPFFADMAATAGNDGASVLRPWTAPDVAPLEEFIERRFPFTPRYYATINGRFSSTNGIKPIRGRGWLPKRRQLYFHVNTDVPKPFQVFWKVRNFGPEAAQANDLRGKIFGGSPELEHEETTRYAGIHWIECYIVKDGHVVASDHFAVGIASS